MFLAIAKKQTPDTIRKKKHDTVHSPPRNAHSINNSHQTSIIQLKAICPCDGGCPRCTPVIQPKLIIGQPDDKYEQEADRVADEVIRMPELRVQRQPEVEEVSVQPKPLADRITPLVQRQIEEEEEEPIQAKLLDGVQIQRQDEEPEEEEEERKEEAAGDEKPEAQVKTADSPRAANIPYNGFIANRVAALRSGGQSLSASARAFFEPRFGRDFSGVRVHTDAGANELADASDAKAFTAGRDIVFADGQYAPSSRAGQQLIAHELTHVVQQQGHDSEPIHRQRASPVRLSVHMWGTLPTDAQKALKTRGYKQSWFDAQNENVRLTVLNLFVKLIGMDLWKYVKSKDTTYPGKLEFKANVTDLKKDLRSRWNFRDPEASQDKWSSAEKRASGSLHFKHSKAWG